MNKIYVIALSRFIQIKFTSSACYIKNNGKLLCAIIERAVGVQRVSSTPPKRGPIVFFFSNKKIIEKLN